MATRGRPIPAEKVRQIRLLRGVLSVRKTAREAGVARSTVEKYQPRR